ncbi:MAG: fimbrillin family protein [Bacteroidales bacterium]|nr:fimbrillin family protein [Bacteroidales bacterium]
MKKLIFAAAIAALALVSCQKTAQVVGERQAVKFSMQNIGTYTMKSVAITETEGLSQVGIFSADLGADNVAATISGSSLTPATPIYWELGQASDADKTFVAYYPYAAGRAVNSAAFLPPYNQDSGEVDYTAYDNFVTARVEACPDDNAVNFAFTHPYAKMIVNITNNLGEDAVTGVKVSGTKLAQAIDISTSSVSITLANEAADVYLKPVAENKYEMILPPQNASPVITVTTTTSSTYVFNINSAYTFTAGGAAQANITLANSASSGEGRQNVSMGVDLTSAAWGNAVEAAFTQDDANSSINCWYLVGTFGDENFGTDHPMTYNGVNNGYEEWVVTFDYTAGVEFKFRQNKEWTNNFGGGALAAGDNNAVAGGENNTLPEAGNYTIYLKLKNGDNKYWVVKN